VSGCADAQRESLIKTHTLILCRKEDFRNKDNNNNGGVYRYYEVERRGVPIGVSCKLRFYDSKDVTTFFQIVVDQEQLRLRLSLCKSFHLREYRLLDLIVRVYLSNTIEAVNIREESDWDYIYYLSLDFFRTVSFLLLEISAQDKAAGFDY